MLTAYAIIGIFFLGGTAFTIFSYALSKLISPHKPSAEKKTTYECGVDTQGTTWVQFKINYFLYGLIFVVFDVETIMLFPLAVEFHELGVFAFFEVVVFISLLGLGLWYIWKEGALEWN